MTAAALKLCLHPLRREASAVVRSEQEGECASKLPLTKKHVFSLCVWLVGTLTDETEDAFAEPLTCSGHSRTLRKETRGHSLIGWSGGRGRQGWRLFNGVECVGKDNKTCCHQHGDAGVEER